MKKYQYLLSVAMAVALLTSACADSGSSDETSPHYTFPVGTILELRQEVYIRPSYARVYFQNGEAGAAVNEFYPHCQLEVRQVLPVVQTVKPDRFVIEKVSYDILDMAALPGLMVAHGGGNGDGGVQHLRVGA